MNIRAFRDLTEGEEYGKLLQKSKCRTKSQKANSYVTVCETKTNLQTEKIYFKITYGANKRVDVIVVYKI